MDRFDKTILAVCFLGVLGAAASLAHRPKKVKLESLALQELNEFSPSCFELAQCLGGTASIEYPGTDKKAVGLDRFHCKVLIKGQPNRALIVAFKQIHTALSTCMLKMFRRTGRGTPT